jgi:hypothetical protein
MYQILENKLVLNYWLLRVSGCDYKLSEKQIRSWIEINGKIRGELTEKAFIDDVDGYRSLLDHDEIISRGCLA